jgi:hypothetical protein
LYAAACQQAAARCAKAGERHEAAGRVLRDSGPGAGGPGRGRGREVRRGAAIDEPRLLVIGRIDGKHWSAVVTRREERIRLISVRRSRPEEVALYEG